MSLLSDYWLIFLPPSPQKKNSGKLWNVLFVSPLLFLSLDHSIGIDRSTYNTPMLRPPGRVARARSYKTCQSEGGACICAPFLSTSQRCSSVWTPRKENGRRSFPCYGGKYWFLGMCLCVSRSCLPVRSGIKEANYSLISSSFFFLSQFNDPCLIHEDCCFFVFMEGFLDREKEQVRPGTNLPPTCSKGRTVYSWKISLTLRHAPAHRRHDRFGLPGGLRHTG